jgi:hypothetical protein
MFGKLNVRLALGEGETAMLSGQMSMLTHKRSAWLLQGEKPASPVSPDFAC